MSQSDGKSPGEKEHEPTQKKLEDARRQGDIAKSSDVLAAASYFGLLLAGFAATGLILDAANSGTVLIEQSPEIARLASGSARTMLGSVLQSAVLPFALFLLVPAIAVLLALMAQKALVFAPEKLLPKLSRISPIEVAKQKFGADGLFEFAKSLVKLVVVSLALGWLLATEADSILVTATLHPRQGLIHMIGLLGQFLILVVMVAAMIGGIDLMWQRHALAQRNRMSREDIMDEMKESEGDPHTRGLRRQRGQDIAMNQMLAEIPKANVVIVNPTHYAVAISWSRGNRMAPVVVAKGVDDTARKIRETAALYGVPIHSDPPTARALYSAIAVGQPISRDHYRAVAAAIRFAEAMRKRAKGRMK